MTHGTKRAKHAKTQNPPGPPQQRDTRVINRFRISAYIGIVIVGAAVAFLNDAKSMWIPPRMGETQYIAQLVLLSALMLLAIRWVYATDKEFKLWARVLQNPTEKWDAYAAIISLSLVMGFCLAYAFDIVKVSMAFTGFLLINYWSQWQSNNHFAHALPETRTKSLNIAQQSVLNVMEQYWLRKPQLARINTMMFFSSLAFSAAWAASFLKEQPRKYEFELTATIALVVNIVLGEILIGVWRYRRNKELVRAETSKTVIPVSKPKLKDATEAYAARVDTWKTAAYWGILGVLALVAAPNDFQSIRILLAWDRQVLSAAGIILFGGLAVLAYRWIDATSNEMEMWIDELRNPMTKKQVHGAMVGLAIVLGALLALAHNILYVSALMAVYFLVNYWTQWLSNKHFAEALERTRKSPLDDTNFKVLDVMEEYWLARPQMARIATMMFFASLAFSLALAGWVQQEPERTRFYLASYGLLFLDILIGEIAIFLWRRDRDNKIQLATEAQE
jgi:hypothetical protein